MDELGKNGDMIRAAKIARLAITCNFKKYRKDWIITRKLGGKVINTFMEIITYSFIFLHFLGRAGVTMGKKNML